MKLNRFENASQFYNRVEDYLLKNEADHCLLFASINSLIRDGESYNFQPYLATVEAEGNIVAVAIRIPPRNLTLSKIEDLAALEIIVQDLYEAQKILYGVSGLTNEAEIFAKKWQTLTGQSYQLKRQLVTHQLDKVQPVIKTSGHLRRTTQSDHSLLLNWLTSFEMEAAGCSQKDAERVVNIQLNRQDFYLWEAPLPVSLVGNMEATPNGSLIGPVYTPPELRRRGYATSCVAALSQTLLAQGCRYCFLFTDLANPTSNHIYRSIGYQPVFNWHDYRFEQS